MTDKEWDLIASGLEKWRKEVDEKISKHEKNWDAWVKDANAKIDKDRANTEKLRKHNYLHTKVVEGYLKEFKTLVKKLASR